MIKIYKKKCGCSFTIDNIDKINNRATLTIINNCNDAKKEREAASKLGIEQSLTNIPFKLTDLDIEIQQGDIIVDIIETIKTLEDK